MPMAEAIWRRMIQIGRSKPAMPTIISSRLRASRVSLAWIVVRLPACPVFMAWSMSSASGAAALADDDPIGPHAQGVADQVAGGDFAAAFDVGGPGFHADHVRLLQTQFGGVLDGGHAFLGGNEGRQGVEQRRLAAARAAGDQTC